MRSNLLFLFLFEFSAAAAISAAAGAAGAAGFSCFLSVQQPENRGSQPDGNERQHRNIRPAHIRKSDRRTGRPELPLAMQ